MSSKKHYFKTIAQTLNGIPLIFQSSLENGFSGLVPKTLLLFCFDYIIRLYGKTQQRNCCFSFLPIIIIPPPSTLKVKEK